MPEAEDLIMASDVRTLDGAEVRAGDMTICGTCGRLLLHPDLRAEFFREAL
jgi:hypothetical protein